VRNVLALTLRQHGWSVLAELRRIGGEGAPHDFDRAVLAYKYAAELRVAILSRLRESHPRAVRKLRPSWPGETPSWALDGICRATPCATISLTSSLPEIFGPDTLLNVVNFVLGCQPVSNTSYVSRVGGNS
jgi:hypothetical protein